MEIESIIKNADTAIERLSDQMEAFADRARLKYDIATVGVFEGKVDILQQIGVMADKVAELRTRLDEIRAEVKAESEGRAA